MQHTKKTIVRVSLYVITLAFLFTGILQSYATGVITHWTGSASSSWGNSSNWDNGIPGSTDTAIIDASVYGSNASPSDGGFTVGGIIFKNSGAFSVTSDIHVTNITGTGTLTSGGITIYIGGNFTVSSYVAGTGAINFNSSTGIKHLVGSYTYHNLNFDGNDTVSITGNLTMGSGGYMQSNGSPVIIVSGSVTGSGTMLIQFSNGAFKMYIGGDMNVSSYSCGSSETIIFNGTSQNVNGYTFRNLTIDNSSGVTLSGSITVNSTMTMTQGSLNLNGQSISYGGTSSLIYNGTSAQTTGPEWPGSFTQNVSFDNTSASGVALGGYVMGYSGTITVAAGTILNVGTQGIAGTGNITFSSGSTLITANTSGSGLNGYITLSGTVNYGSATNFIFNGGGAQATGTNMPGTCASLTVNNSSGLTLSAPLTVTGTLTLSSGTLTLGSNKLTIGSSGSISGASSLSYIKTNGSGVLEMNASGSGVLYPIGDSYNPITITDAGNNTWDVSVSNGVTDQSNVAITNDAINRTWSIEQTSGSPVTVTVAPQWTNTSDWAGATFNQTNDMVSSRTSLTTAWTPSQSPTNDNNVSGSFYNLTSGNITTASGTLYYIGVGDNSSALPVSLINFNVEYQPGISNLTWQTASEINNNYFEIERSTNGQSWVSIGKVSGHGNSVVIEDYTYLDNLAGVLPSGTIYYRLKQVDYNGNYQYSMIRAISLSQTQAENTTFPNPVSNVLNMNWTNPEDNNEAVISIMNTSGSTIYSEKVNGAGSMQKQLDMSGYPSGTYIIQVSSGNKNIMSRNVIKE